MVVANRILLLMSFYLFAGCVPDFEELPPETNTSPSNVAGQDEVAQSSCSGDCRAGATSQCNPGFECRPDDNGCFVCQSPMGPDASPTSDLTGGQSGQSREDGGTETLGGNDAADQIAGTEEQSAGSVGEDESGGATGGADLMPVGGDVAGTAGGDAGERVYWEDDNAALIAESPCSVDFTGVCQTDTRPCDGVYQSGVCPGPAEIRCCVPLENGGADAIAGHDGSDSEQGGHEMSRGQERLLETCSAACSNLVECGVELESECEGEECDPCLDECNASVERYAGSDDCLELSNELWACRGRFSCDELESLIGSDDVTDPCQGIQVELDGRCSAWNDLCDAPLVVSHSGVYEVDTSEVDNMPPSQCFHSFRPVALIQLELLKESDVALAAQGARVLQVGISDDCHGAPFEEHTLACGVDVSTDGPDTRSGLTVRLPAGSYYVYGIEVTETTGPFTFSIDVSPCGEERFCIYGEAGSEKNTDPNCWMSADCDRSQVCGERGGPCPAECERAGHLCFNPSYGEGMGTCGDVFDCTSDCVGLPPDSDEFIQCVVTCVEHANEDALNHYFEAIACAHEQNCEDPRGAVADIPSSCAACGAQYEACYETNFLDIAGSYNLSNGDFITLPIYGSGQLHSDDGQQSFTLSDVSLDDQRATLNYEGQPAEVLYWATTEHGLLFCILPDRSENRVDSGDFAQGCHDGPWTVALPEGRDYLVGLFTETSGDFLSLESNVIRHLGPAEISQNGRITADLQRVIPIAIEYHELDNEKALLDVLVRRLDVGESFLAFEGPLWATYIFYLGHESDAIWLCRRSDGAERASEAVLANSADHEDLTRGCNGGAWSRWEYAKPSIAGHSVDNAGIPSLSVETSLPFSSQLDGWHFEVVVDEQAQQFEFPPTTLIPGRDALILSRYFFEDFQNLERLLLANAENCVMRLSSPGNFLEVRLPCPDFNAVGSGALVGTDENPGESCSDILARRPSAEDGEYFINIQNPTLSPAEVYCDMETDGGGWTLVAEHHDRMSECPGGWVFLAGHDVCERPGGELGSSAEFSSLGIRYSEIRGRAVLHQVGAPNAFEGRNDSVRIVGNYVDGLAILRRANRNTTAEHVWSYALASSTRAGIDALSGPDFTTCPVGRARGTFGVDPLQRDSSVPDFVGESYSCASGHLGASAPAAEFVSRALFADDDDFHLVLDAPSTEHFEVRMMTDEPRTAEDIYLRELKIWIR